MKITLKQITASVAFALIFVMLLLVSSYIFMPKNNLEEFGMEDASANGILGEKSDTIDVLVLGDSEAYSSITPMKIWQDYGFTTYVCSTSGQYLSHSETLLKQAFKKQKPKVVILETNAIYRKMKYEKSIMTVAENYFSVVRYHNRWKEIRPNDFFGKVEYTWTDDFKGYHYSTNIAKADASGYMKPTDKVEEIADLNKDYVKLMADFCKENSADFILVSTPSTENWNCKRHNGIQKLAEELNIKYIDLNMGDTKLDIDWNKDTRDAGDHLNYYGAVKVTDFLGRYIKDNYDMPDNRNNPEYVKWNESLERYLKKVK